MRDSVCGCGGRAGSTGRTWRGGRGGPTVGVVTLSGCLGGG